MKNTSIFPFEDLVNRVFFMPHINRITHAINVKKLSENIVYSHLCTRFGAEREQTITRFATELLLFIETSVKNGIKIEKKKLKTYTS